LRGTQGAARAGVGASGGAARDGSGA
jgi:hypothetical protein